MSSECEAIKAVIRLAVPSRMAILLNCFDGSGGVLRLRFKCIEEDLSSWLEGGWDIARGTMAVDNVKEFVAI